MPPKLQNPPESSGSTLSPGKQKEGQNLMPKDAEIAPGYTQQPSGPLPNKLAAAPPSLRLTAISWNEEPSKRFAFVNGIMTYEGGVIEGVKIVEIYPNRVRFLHNERYFEISID